MWSAGSRTRASSSQPASSGAGWTKRSSAEKGDLESEANDLVVAPELVPHGADSCDSAGPQPESAVQGAGDAPPPAQSCVLARYASAEWGNLVERELVIARTHAAKNGVYFADLSHAALLQLLVDGRARAREWSQGNEGAAPGSQDSSTPDAVCAPVLSSPACGHREDMSGSSSVGSCAGSISVSICSGHSPEQSPHSVRWCNPIVTDHVDPAARTASARAAPLKPCRRGLYCPDAPEQPTPRRVVRSAAELRRAYLVRLGFRPSADAAAARGSANESGAARPRAEEAHAPAGGPERDAPAAGAGGATWDDTEMAYALGQAMRVAEDMRGRRKGMIRGSASWSAGRLPPSRGGRLHDSDGSSPSKSSPKKSPTGMVRSRSAMDLKQDEEPRMNRSSSATNLSDEHLYGGKDQLLYGGWCM